MIPVAEIRALAAEWKIDEHVVEKDYMLGWTLAAIASEPALRDRWVFKGGTALRKCYFETYRLSEDLDFTVIDSGPETPEDLVPILGRMKTWLQTEAGLEIAVDPQAVRRRKNRRGNPTTEARIAYRGPRNPPGLPNVKIDLTSDEWVTARPVSREIHHPYSDRPETFAAASCYPAEEVLAEKLRALAERCRPRDLYDVVLLHRHPDVVGPAEPVREMLGRKCEHAGIPVPTLNSIETSPFREEIEAQWKNMLSHQLPHLPPFREFWSALADLFSWLGGRDPRPQLARAAGPEALDPSWVAPQFMAPWRSAAPLELIRFAGANRLKVDLDDRAQDGPTGWRLVEPYSLRRAQDGQLLLYVVNDRGLLRAYRVDRIRGARVSDEPFTPRYLVEF